MRTRLPAQLGTAQSDSKPPAANSGNKSGLLCLHHRSQWPHAFPCKGTCLRQKVAPSSRWKFRIQSCIPAGEQYGSYDVRTKTATTSEDMVTEDWEGKRFDSPLRLIGAVEYESKTAHPQRAHVIPVQPTARLSQLQSRGNISSSSCATCVVPWSAALITRVGHLMALRKQLCQQIAEDRERPRRDCGLEHAVSSRTLQNIARLSAIVAIISSGHNPNSQSQFYGFTPSPVGCRSQLDSSRCGMRTD